MNDLYHANITKDATLTRQRDRLLTFQTNLEGAVNNARSTIQSSWNAEFLVAMSDLETLLEDIKSQQPLETQEDCQFKTVAFNRELLIDVINNAGELIRSSACATTTKAAGSGLIIAPMGKDSFFTISAHDYQGRSLGVGGDIFVVNLQTDNKKFVKVNVIDQGNMVLIRGFIEPPQAQRVICRCQCFYVVPTFKAALFWCVWRIRPLVMYAATHVVRKVGK